jgi:hypothetical protein
MKTEFEKKLKEHGFSYQRHPDDFYILSRNDDIRCKIKVQLISAEPVLEVLQMSHNGNKLEAIGSFKLNLMDMTRENDIFIFVFENTVNQCVEFIIISSKEFKRRLIESYRIPGDNPVLNIVFWLLSDGYNDNKLYETTDVGIEWEWYFLSKGKTGRIVDNTDLDYTEFLNNWEKLKMI